MSAKQATTPKKKKRKKKGKHRQLISFGLTVGVLGFALWLLGADFYGAHPWARADHPSEPWLRSSGAWGLTLEITGATLIVLNLVFLLRKHVKALGRFGKLKTWLDLHVLSGLLGPLLVVFHTTFELRTDVAATAAIALAIVVATGVIGRYVFSMVPRHPSGMKLSRKALEKALVAALAGAAAASAPAPRRVPTSRVGCLFTLPLVSLQLSFARVRLWWQGRGLTTEEVHALHRLLLARRELHLFDITRGLLKWWRAIHRVVAVATVLLAVLHVVAVLHLGYGPGDGS